ncbi:hypothetical protein GCM10017687_19610 [Streptomyces echinatus]|uniref:pyridoxal-dependent decarboxylase n=1 Tax=Streptomyces echinatus TaxID=67293 RepID=UPI0031E96A2A
MLIPTPRGTLDPAALDETLTALPGPVLVAATAGTTDTGLIDPLPEIAGLCTATAPDSTSTPPTARAPLQRPHRDKLAGLEAAHTVTLDLHKLGWQPVAAGLLAVARPGELTTLHQHTDYLKRRRRHRSRPPRPPRRSLRTTRRPDILKIAVTLRTLGRSGLGALADQVCARARESPH